MKKSNQLLYRQIEEHLIGLIEKKHLKAGDSLPAERELGKQFNASQYPVRQAIRSLIAEGVLQKIPSKGTFVKRQSRKPVATNKIGVLHCRDEGGFFASSFYSAIMSGIEAESNRHRKIPMICPFFDYSSGITLNPTSLELARDADGLILVDLHPHLAVKIQAALRQTNKPVVVVNYERELAGTDSVVTDSFGDTKKMIEFLIGLGHKRIACIYMDMHKETHPNFLNRIAAYRETLAAHGITAEEKLIKNLIGGERSDINPATHHNIPAQLPVWHQAQLIELLELPNPVTAIFCPSDDTAIFVSTLAQRLGYRVPTDLTVVGFDDALEAKSVTPALTTVHTPLIDMGALAVKRLLEKIKEQKEGLVTYNKIVVPGNIVERQSHQKK